MRALQIVIVFGCLAAFSAASSQEAAELGAGAVLRIEARAVSVVRRQPAVPMGLAIDADGAIVESTAGPRSALSVLPRGRGTPSARRTLADRAEGRGVALLDGGLALLFDTGGVASLFTLPALDLVASRSYDRRVLGACRFGAQVVLSDGTSSLTFVSVGDLVEQRVVDVVDAKAAPVGRLGELECSERLVYAHLVPEPMLVVIDPVTGTLAGIVDLLPAVPAGAGPLSAVAYDPARGLWVLAGIGWPVLVEAVFSPFGSDS